jgi:hypothetical protein
MGKGAEVVLQILLSLKQIIIVFLKAQLNLEERGAAMPRIDVSKEKVKTNNRWF